ncbi:SCO6745 family protein [Streptomyces sp. NPDC054841]
MHEMVTDRSTARVMHDLLEPVHAIVFFAPEVATAYQEVGMQPWWTGYFAARAAPLGAVNAGVVAALFYHFHPEMVAREFPKIWESLTPAEVLARRLAGVDRALRRVLADDLDSAELAEAAELVTAAVAACDTPGRPLAAANAVLPVPPQPHLALWQAATTLREYRGDGHVTALMQAGLDGVEALVTITAAGGEERASIQQRRGWADREWAAAEDRLTARGLLDDDRSQTEAGRIHRQSVEDLTDELAAAPWRVLGQQRIRRLQELLAPLSTKIAGCTP